MYEDAFCIPVNDVSTLPSTEVTASVMAVTGVDWDTKTFLVETSTYSKKELKISFQFCFVLIIVAEKSIYIFVQRVDHIYVDLISYGI